MLDPTSATASGPPLLVLLVTGLLANLPSGVSEASVAAGDDEVAPAEDVDLPLHLRGVDPNGRIPKVALPPELPHPHRWRYLPEGRLSDGNIFERFLTSTFILPIVSFDSDIGTLLGLSLTDIDFRNRRRREFATTTFTYSTEGQQGYSVGWRRWLDQLELEGGGVVQEERSFVQAGGGYERTLTRRFFGIGPESREGDETSFTDETTRLGASYRRALPERGGDFIAGLGAFVEHRNLARGHKSKLPSTDDSFPELFDDGDGIDSLWVEGELSYDLRDSQANPYRGGSLTGWLKGTPLMTAGRGGAVYGLRGNWVIEVPGLVHRGGDADEEHPPTDVLALSLQAEDSSGNLPFWALPSLGGSHRMRGYIANRWTDSAAWFAAAEYRFVCIPRGVSLTERVHVERLGMALFYELGAVGPSSWELDASPVRSSYGFSMRAGLDRADVFRLDLGFSDEGVNFAARYGLSF